MKLVILVVSGSADLARRFAAVYNFDDWEAEVYPDRASALDALRGEKHYDIILTSQAAMEGESMEFTREVCAIERHKSTPIIIISDTQ